MDDQISENFRLPEFFSPNDRGKTFRVRTPKAELVLTLEAIRSAIGRELYIESGIRSVEHNAGLRGSSPKSGHLTGEAADIYTAGMTNRQLGAVIRGLHAQGKLPYLTYTYLITGSSGTRVHVGVDRQAYRSIWGAGY
jgi:uncharacterized protein YcbK (DUF882 family)